MSPERYAGPCMGRKHHRWSKHQYRRTQGVNRSVFEQPCCGCDRLRIIVYGRRGNRCVGYENRGPTSVLSPRIDLAHAIV